MNRMPVRKCADHGVYVQERFVSGILCTYMLLVLLVMLINCDVYRGQAGRDLSECLWGDRFLDGFNQESTFTEFTA